MIGRSPIRVRKPTSAESKTDSSIIAVVELRRGRVPIAAVVAMEGRGQLSSLALQPISCRLSPDGTWLEAA